MKGPLAYVFCCHIAATMLRKFESDRRQRLLLPFLSLCMLTTNTTYYILHKLESINDWNLSLRIKKRKKCRNLQDSYFQSTASQSRMLTNTPWGQKDFGAKLNETDLTLKYKSFVKLWSLPDTAHCALHHIGVVDGNQCRINNHLKWAT